MLLPTQTSWVILAGGQASRMGGKDKGLVELNGSPLIQYVINKLSQQDVSITINANRNLDSYQAFAPVVSDSFLTTQVRWVAFMLALKTRTQTGLALSRATAHKSVTTLLSVFVLQ